MKRVTLIVLDSVGIGAQPDSAQYGDAGAHTLSHVINSTGIELPQLAALGLGNIEGAQLPFSVAQPRASYARLQEVSKGKDTTTGHWELAGLELTQAFPTFPDGFPQALLDEFSRLTGHGVLGNCVASGTEIIERLGEEHLRTGKLIVYTSADSVFQIAAHESIVPPQELWHYSEIARELLKYELCVGRVIARPFTGEPGSFTRTANRRDFSAMMPGDTMLDIIARAGMDTVAIGKIEDIFAHRGLTKSNHAAGNPACIIAALEAMDAGFEGLLFVNLVDFDMRYGHRNDPDGYAQALREFDDALPEFYSRLTADDMLMITADHGCDPTYPGTDHTREYVPMLCYSPALPGGIDLGTRMGYMDVAATVLEALGIPGAGIKGHSFYRDMIGE